MMVKLRTVAKDLYSLWAEWGRRGREGEGECVGAELACGDEIKGRVGVEELVQKLAR